MASGSAIVSCNGGMIRSRANFCLKATFWDPPSQRYPKGFFASHHKEISSIGSMLFIQVELLMSLRSGNLAVECLPIIRRFGFGQKIIFFLAGHMVKDLAGRKI